MNTAVLQIRLIDTSLEAELAHFFEIIRACGDDRYFHPHPFTPEEAYRLAHYNGADLFYVLMKGKQIIGYGLLRGWDEGYTVPSLGIYIADDVRGRGLGRLVMRFLAAAAREKGAEMIRLKVYPDNVAAVKLYESLGYRFMGRENGQLVGYLDL